MGDSDGKGPIIFGFMFASIGFGVFSLVSVSINVAVLDAETVRVSGVDVELKITGESPIQPAESDSTNADTDAETNWLNAVAERSKIAGDLAKATESLAASRQIVADLESAIDSADAAGTVKFNGRQETLAVACRRCLNYRAQLAAEAAHVGELEAALKALDAIVQKRMCRPAR